MLRYRPSQEFSPTTIPSQNTALVTYKLPELAVNQQSPDEPGIDTALIHRNAKAAVRQTNLRSLLDFARWANDRDRASVSLDRFLQQVQHERDEAEAALKKQTTTAATSFVDKFLRLALESQSCSCGTSDKDLQLHSHTEDTPSLALEGLGLLGGHVLPDTLHGLQQPKTPSPSCGLTIWHRASQSPMELEVGEIDERENIKELTKPKGETQPTPHECDHQDLQTVSTLSQQLLYHVRLPPATAATIQIMYTSSGNHISVRETERLQEVTEPAFQARSPMSYGPQDESAETMQAQPSDYEHVGLSTDVVRVNIPFSGPGSLARSIAPSTSTPSVSMIARIPADEHGDVKEVGHTTVIANLGWKLANSSGNTWAVSSKSTKQDSTLEKKVSDKIPKPATIFPAKAMMEYDFQAREFRNERRKEQDRQYFAGKKEAEELTQASLACKSEGQQSSQVSPALNAHAPKTPVKDVKETVAKLMVRKKEHPVHNGTDHFLALLDLVRKK